MNSQLMGLLELKQGANNLPYEIPMHPNLVHFTLGLFIIAIVFDIAGALFPLERPILKFLALPALRSGFFEVGWYNLVASAAITFFTVAWGFFEAMLANCPLMSRVIGDSGRKRLCFCTAWVESCCWRQLLQWLFGEDCSAIAGAGMPPGRCSGATYS